MATADYEMVLALALQLSVEDRQRLVEDLVDIRLADEAKRDDPFGLPLDEAHAQIERERSY
jgi:hypothetical protein